MFLRGCTLVSLVCQQVCTVFLSLLRECTVFYSLGVKRECAVTHPLCVRMDHVLLPLCVRMDCVLHLLCGRMDHVLHLLCAKRNCAVLCPWSGVRRKAWPLVHCHLQKSCLGLGLCWPIPWRPALAAKQTQLWEL